MRIAKGQIKAFLIGLSIIIIIVILNLSDLSSFFAFQIIIIFIMWFFTLFALREKKPLDYDNFKYKPNVLSLLDKNICPFCEKNPISEYKIAVGYTKARFQLGYYLLWFTYSYNRDQFKTSVPLCKYCKDRFLQNKLPNPSYSILERKRGFSLGLRLPYEKGHILNEMMRLITYSVRHKIIKTEIKKLRLKIIKK